MSEEETNDHALDNLLAQGGLSGPEQDALFGGIEKRRRRARLWRWGVWIALAVAATTLAFAIFS